MSGNGRRIAATTGSGTYTDGSVYSSSESDFDDDWVEQTAIGNHAWSAIAASYTGSRLAVVSTDGSIYLATVEGAATNTFHYSSLGFSGDPAIANAVLSVTSNTCYTINSASTKLFSASGVTAPAPNVTLLGGIAFGVSCTTAGGSADTTVRFGTYYPDLTKLRIYKQATASSELKDVTSQVTLANSSVDGQPVTTIRYTITDGGNFDEDDGANGSIADPIYVGIVGAGSTGALAATGQSYLAVACLAGCLIMAGFSLTRFGRKR